MNTSQGRERAVLLLSLTMLPILAACQKPEASLTPKQEITKCVNDNWDPEIWELIEFRPNGKDGSNASMKISALISFPRNPDEDLEPFLADLDANEVTIHKSGDRVLIRAETLAYIDGGRGAGMFGRKRLESLCRDIVPFKASLMEWNQTLPNVQLDNGRLSPPPPVP